MSPTTAPTAVHSMGPLTANSRASLPLMWIVP